MGVAADILGLPSTTAAVLRGLFASAIAEGLKVTAWAKGGATRAVYRSMGDFGKVLVDAIGNIADQGFLESASDDGLTILARNKYGIIRGEATFATTDLRIDNAGTNSYPYSPTNPLILTSSITKKIYVSQGEGTIAPLTNNQTLSVQAQEAGSASTATTGQIDQWVTPVTGLSIAQPLDAIGSDATSDADLKAACRARIGFVPTASTIGAGGAAGAYESVARTGPDGKGGVVRPDGTRITVTRVKTFPDGAGGVTMYVADEDGPITVGDLALVEAAVLAYAKPVGVPVGVNNASVYAITDSNTVIVAWVRASATATDDEIRAAIRDACRAYTQTVDIGGYDILGSGNVMPIRGGIEDAATDGAKAVAGVIKLQFSVPTADIPLAASEVPVVTGANSPEIVILRVPNT